MTTASQQLAEHGISMELAHSWVIANFAHPAGVLAACAKYGVTNAMLGEVVGWPGAPLAAGEVKAFFLSKGLNSVILDPAPGMATVRSTQVRKRCVGSCVDLARWATSASSRR